jgi:hypothetical protein
MKKLPFGKTQETRDEPTCGEPHDEFLELCALSTSGTLTESEQRRLESHLSSCHDCRKAMREFNAVVDEVIPSIASDCIRDDEPSGSGSWSQDQVLNTLLKRLHEEDHRRQLNHKHQPFSSAQNLRLANSDTWRNIWTLYATGVLLFITLTILLYRIGIRAGEHVASVIPLSAKLTADTINTQLTEAQHEYQVSQAEILERDRIIANLRRDLQRQSADLNHFKLKQQSLESELGNEETDKQSLAQERSELAETLNAAQSRLESLQQRLVVTEKRASEENATVAALQDRIRDLAGLLDARNKAIDDEEELLSHDRDIRELMGARDLYIAEVYDVGDNGATRKPYGRVFYTKGKSLIFYAYDLDQQTNVKNASTFQAWGMRGTDRQQALSLGIFYEDNDSKKRWVLKTSDSKLLEQVDEVFVTVEPNGGSHRPSTRPLLFAYLRVGANHP